MRKYRSPRHVRARVLRFVLSRSELRSFRKTHARSRWETTAARAPRFYVFINFPYYFYVSFSTHWFFVLRGTFGKFSRWHRRCHWSPVRVTLFLYSCISFHGDFKRLIAKINIYRRHFSLSISTSSLSPPCDSEDTVPFRAKSRFFFQTELICPSLRSFCSPVDDVTSRGWPSHAGLLVLAKIAA